MIDGVSTTLTPEGNEPEFDPGAFVCLNSNDSNDNGIPDLEDFANTNSIPLTPLDPDFVNLTLAVVGLDANRRVWFNHQVGVGNIRVWEEVADPPDTLQLVTAFSIEWDPNIPPPVGRGAFADANPAPTFYVEGIKTSTSHRDTWMGFRYAPPNNQACFDKVRITVIETDLDADLDAGLHRMADKTTGSARGILRR